MKRDVPILGFIIGALLPLLGFFIVYLIFKQGETLGEFISGRWPNHKAFAKILTLSLLVNLVPFVWFNSKRKDYLSRGVFIATMLYVVFIILVMFVW
jgi:amino acid permease